METIEKATTQKDVQSALESHVRNALFRVVVVAVAVIKNNIKLVQKSIKLFSIKNSLVDYFYSRFALEPIKKVKNRIVLSILFLVITRTRRGQKNCLDASIFHFVLKVVSANFIVAMPIYSIPIYE